MKPEPLCRVEHEHFHEKMQDRSALKPPGAASLGPTGVTRRLERLQSRCFSTRA